MNRYPPRSLAINRIAFAWIALTAACLADGDTPTDDTPDRTPAQVDDADSLPEAHPPLTGLDIQSRGSRRLSVPQLLRSMEVFGGLEPGTIDIPRDLTVTLGQPDYLQTTEENLDPSPLFMKFMMDLAGLICRDLAAAEQTRPPDDRIFTRFASLQDNLKDALRLATGIDGDDATPYVQRLTRVFEAGRRGPDGDQSGHEAVCIALLTSPEFLLY